MHFLIGLKLTLIYFCAVASIFHFNLKGFFEVRAVVFIQNRRLVFLKILCVLQVQLQSSRHWQWNFSI